MPSDTHTSDDGAHPHESYTVLDTFERFSQVDDVFSRSRWDPTVQSDETDRFYATYRASRNRRLGILVPHMNP